ncbi:MAG: aminotransferase class III-fold pyridoxal phosphate-dependent enzyme, partial [Stackebrandtia sp.]
MTPTSETIAEEVRRRYTRRTPGSLQLHEAAKEHLPGGDTRTINHFTPYPTFMERGDGCTLVDVDDNVYIDFNNNMSAVAHGHGHPALVAAAAEQYPRGVALGAPNAGQARLAGVLRSRVPSMDKVRFCSTGTEATMLALQTARAFTKRDVIAKIDGGYHGFHNDVRFNMFTGMTEPAYPQPGLPESFPPVQVPRGVPYDYMNDVAMVPYND